ncbi:hypothetical protein D3C71_189740 [compost metagenome]
MADIDSKNKDTVDGFDFDGMDWGNDSDDAAAAVASSSSKSSLGEDDPFNSATDDDGFGGSDSFYSLEQMPDADGQDSFSDLGGDDFGDIKTDDEPVSYDFGGESDDLPAGRVISDGPSSYEEAEDPFNSASSYSSDQDDEESIDPFAAPVDGSEGDASDEQAAPADKPKSSKLVTYVMAAAAAVVAVGGIVYVMPSLLGGGSPVEVAQVRPAQAPDSFPASLPGQNKAQPEIAPAEIAVANPPALAVPATPAAADPAGLAPPALSLPDLPEAQPVKPALTLPQPTATAAADPQPVAPVKEDPFKDLVGGKERGGIDAMKDKDPVVAVAAPAVSSDEVAKLSARLDALEGKVDRLADSFDNFVQSPVKEAPKAVAPAEIAAASTGDVNPPMKPPIIEGVSLKGVAGDVAWISTKSGVVEVKAGDDVPNGGKVVSFRNYRGEWIVVTTDGLIVRQ